jgi:hypothetical protein
VLSPHCFRWLFFLFFFPQKKQTSRGLKLAAKFAVFVSLHFLCFFRAAVSLSFFPFVPEGNGSGRLHFSSGNKTQEECVGGGMTRPPGTMSCKWENRRMPFSSLSSQPRCGSQVWMEWKMGRSFSLIQRHMIACMLSILVGLALGSVSGASRVCEQSAGHDATTSHCGHMG